MKLGMRNKDQDAETLPSYDDKIKTGNMGDCVCVIVMWNYNGVNRQYAQVRGFHGNGGIRAVNLTSLFVGVTDNQDTLVWIVCGPNNSQYDWSLEDTMHEVRWEAPQQAMFVIYHGIASATFNRSGYAQIVRELLSG